MLQLVLVLRRADDHVRHDARVRDVEHALVRLAVIADETGAVDADRHRQRLQRDVVDELIERALQEGRVNVDDGLESRFRHSRGHDHRVLFGDADVEHALGEMFPHFDERGALEHRRADGHDLLVALHQIDERPGEHLRVRVARHRVRRNG